MSPDGELVPMVEDVDHGMEVGEGRDAQIEMQDAGKVGDLFAVYEDKSAQPLEPQAPAELAELVRAAEMTAELAPSTQ